MKIKEEILLAILKIQNMDLIKKWNLLKRRILNMILEMKLDFHIMEKLMS